MKQLHIKFIWHNLLTPISCMYKKVPYFAGGCSRIDADTIHCAAPVVLQDSISRVIISSAIHLQCLISVPRYQ
jgi:hypothetical protein